MITRRKNVTDLHFTAEKLAATLSELASHAKPGSIVSVEAIRRAMGITLPEKKAQPVEEAATEAK